MSELKPDLTSAESVQVREGASFNAETTLRMLLAAQSALEPFGIDASKLAEAQEALKQVRAVKTELGRLGIKTEHIINEAELSKAVAKLQVAQSLMKRSGQVFIDKSEFSVLESSHQQQPTPGPPMTDDQKIAIHFEATANSRPKPSPWPEGIRFAMESEGYIEKPLGENELMRLSRMTPAERKEEKKEEKKIMRWMKYGG